jgi:hypothetical protein
MMDVVAADYPECDRLVQAAKETQPVGDFLEWLSEQRISLTVWGNWKDEESCFRCSGEGKIGRRVCPACEGTRTVHVEREGYLPVTKSREQLLAEWKGIDLSKVEAERRAMLNKIRAAQAVPAD